MAMSAMEEGGGEREREREADDYDQLLAALFVRLTSDEK